MDPQLEEDFAEALEGCDPMQFLLQDPDLADVAQDVLEILDNEDIDAVANCDERFEDVTDINVGSTSGDDSGMSTKSPSLSPHSGDSESNSKDEADGYPKKSNGRTSTYKFKCVACGRPARGYHYFGAIVCNGCRSFFCRAIKNDSYKSYICSEAFKCQHCRFEMLLQAGMKIPDNNNKIQKFSKDLHAENFVYVGKKGSLTRMYLDKTRELLTNADSLTLTEKTSVEEITSWQFSISVEIFRRLIRTNLGLFRETLQTYYTGHRHSLKTQKLVEDYLTYGIQKSYSERDCWAIKDNLSSRDRAKLVTANYPLIMEFMEAFKLRSEESGELSREVDGYVGSMVEGLDSDDERQVLFDIHKEVKQALINNNMYRYRYCILQIH